MTETPTPELLDRACQVAATGAPFLSDERKAFAWLASALPALLADRARLDALDREARIEPLVLHDGRSDYPKGFRGLGLMPGNLRRDLREAIDQAFRRLPCSESTDANG